MEEQKIQELSKILKTLENDIDYELYINAKQYLTEEEAWHLRTIFAQIVRRHTIFNELHPKL